MRRACRESSCQEAARCCTEGCMPRCAPTLHAAPRPTAACAGANVSRTIVRVRPRGCWRERAQPCTGCAQAFDFDRAFPPGASQAEVFEDVSPLVTSALDGYNVCIFAYGQTGARAARARRCPATRQARARRPRAQKCAIAARAGAPSAGDMPASSAPARGTRRGGPHSLPPARRASLRSAAARAAPLAALGPGRRRAPACR